MPESRMEKVREMIKKTLPKTHLPCFDGCVLFIEEHCQGVRAACIQGMESKFHDVKKEIESMNGKLDNINIKIDQIIGNGHNEH